MRHVQVVSIGDVFRMFKEDECFLVTVYPCKVQPPTCLTTLPSLGAGPGMQQQQEDVLAPGQPLPVHPQL